MKKFKIFLLLSILLSFGFALSSEVHAQGGGPKIFEVGDVLPATTQLRISWVNDILNIPKNSQIYSNNGSNRLVGILESGSILIRDSLTPTSITIYSGATNAFLSPYTNYDGNHAYCVIDTSTWDENNRTISSVSAGMDIFTWEDLNDEPPITPSEPKDFEIGDVLPAGYIKISWDFTGKPIDDDGTFNISTSGDLFIEIVEFNNIELYINYEEFDAETPSYTIITLTEPVTITDVGGTADYNTYIGDALMWEVMPPEYSNGYDNVYDGERLEIEEGTILPAAKIGINLLFNNTGGSKSGTITYTFGTWAQLILTAQEDNYSTQVTSAVITFNLTNPNWEVYVIDDTLANQSFGSTRGILFAAYLSDFSWATEEERTITDITIEGDLEIDAIFTRILTEEELAYQEGYTNGYTTAREIFGWKDGDNWYNGIDAWNLGEKYARELYGFYDSTTDEWLSVSEYIARYGTGGGTDPSGPTDFYNNFDKYFIPAMIIVFGGAIVLTILKVFKGRE